MITSFATHLEPDSKIEVYCYRHDVGLGGAWTRLELGDTSIFIHASAQQLCTIANQLNEAVKRIEGRERA